MSPLRLAPADAEQIADATGVCVLVGGYDGSGNFGDILQLEAALRAVRPSGLLPVAVIESQCAGQHDALRARFPALFADTCFACYVDNDDDVDARLQAEGSVGAPNHGPTVLYLYGGGYLNGMWGARKVALARAAEALSDDPVAPLAVLATGLQVDAATIAPGGVGRSLVRRAEIVGLRDMPSLMAARAALEPIAPVFSGDDAAQVLAGDAPFPADGDPGVVNLHLSAEGYVAADPDVLAYSAAAVLCGLRDATGGGGLTVQLVHAYEEPRISERAVLDRFAADHLTQGFRTTPLDVLEDTLDGDLARLRGAGLTITCSYHVGLSSMLHGIPTLMLVGNEYYRHKANGLRDLFDLPHDWVLEAGTADPAAAVATARAALVPGRAREDLVARLAAGRERALAARAQAVELLGAALAVPADERERRRVHALARVLDDERAAAAAARDDAAVARRRAEEAAESARTATAVLEDVTGTRAWRAARRLYAVRGALGRRRKS